MTLAALPGRLVLAVAVLWSTATVSLTAAPVCRIRHPEVVSVDAPQIEGSAALQKSGRSSRVRFEAFGRPFELDLQSNDRILRELPAVARARLPTHALYRVR